MSKKTIDNHGGPTAFSRLTGISMSTINDRYYSRKEQSYTIRLLFELLALTPAGIIKSAAQRADLNNS